MSVLPLLDQAISVAGLLLLLVGSRRLAGSNRAEPARVPLVRDEVILFSMLAYFGAAMLLGGWMKTRTPDEALQRLVVNNAAQFAGVAACLLMVARSGAGGIPTFVFGPRDRDASAASSISLETLGFIIIALGVCPLIRDATSWLILLVKPDFSFELHPTLKALENAPPPGRAIMLWLSAALVAPIAEEVFFRGLLQNFLRQAVGLGAAVALTSVAFSAVHFSQLYALPALFFLGLLLGIAYARHQTLLVPIAIHAAFNFKTLVWESFSRTT